MNAFEILAERALKNLKNAIAPIEEAVREQSYLQAELREVHKSLGIKRSNRYEG